MEVRYLVDCLFWRNRSIMDNSCDIRNADQYGFHLWFLYLCCFKSWKLELFHWRLQFVSGSLWKTEVSLAITVFSDIRLFQQYCWKFEILICSVLWPKSILHFLSSCSFLLLSWKRWISEVTGWPDLLSSTMPSLPSCHLTTPTLGFSPHHKLAATFYRHQLHFSSLKM